MFEPGDRVELIHTNDPYTKLRPGLRGTVRRVIEVSSEFTQISIHWDDGSNLMLIPEEGDQVRKVDEDD